MLTFKQYLNETPEWEKPCWIVAINKTTGTTDTKIKKMAKTLGWDGKTESLSTNDTISILWDILGKKPDFTQTGVINKNKTTPKKYSGSTKLTGLVFTKAHVMPMINGTVSNFNGHGEETVTAVVTFDK